MAERCPDCERPVSTNEQDYVLGLDEDRCIQVGGGGAYLMSNCAKYTIRLLRAKLTKLEAERDAMAKVIAAGEALRTQVSTDALYLPETGLYDAAKAEIEKLRPQGEEA